MRYSVETYYYETGDFEREFKCKTFREAIDIAARLCDEVLDNGEVLGIRIFDVNKFLPIAEFNLFDE